MKFSDRLVIAILAIILGALFIAYKNTVISIAMTILGIALIALSIIDFVNKNDLNGVIKAIAGIALIVFGWLLVSVVLYLLAVLLIVYGAISIYKLFNENCKTFFDFLPHALCLLIGLCLLFNQGGTIAWVFIVTGVALIVHGVITLIEELKQ